MGLEFAHVLLHPLHDLVVILGGGPVGVQVPEGQLLGQDLEEGDVLIGHDGLVDAPLGEGPGGDDLPVVQLDELSHAVVQAVGKNQALHLVVVPDAVVAPGGVEHPVAYVHQIQQPAVLFLCQMQLHSGPPLGICSPTV